MISLHNIPNTTQARWLQQGYCPWPRREMKGQTYDPAYKCWESMIQRCTNPKFTDYNRYGGRGITIHPSFRSFLFFINYIGPRPSPSHSIDRINVNGNYEPGNVKWSTVSDQNSNRRIKIEKHGRKYRYTKHGMRFIFNSLEEAEASVGSW